MKPYKSVFEDSLYVKKKEQTILYDAEIYQSPSIRFIEAVINTDVLGDILFTIFSNCIKECKNKTYRNDLFLLYDINKSFAKENYNVSFTYEVELNSKEGIIKMSSDMTNNSIIVSCDSTFKEKFLSEDKELLNTFKILIKHELVHIGQYLRMKAEKLSIILAKLLQKKNNFQAKIKNSNIPEDSKEFKTYYNYFSNKRKIMVYAKTALLELQLSGLSKKEILTGIKTMFSNYEKSNYPISKIISNYHKYFDMNIDMDRKFLKLFYKYLYEYYINSGKELLSMSK